MQKAGKCTINQDSLTKRVALALESFINSFVDECAGPSGGRGNLVSIPERLAFLKQRLFEVTQEMRPLFDDASREPGTLLLCLHDIQERIDALRVYLTRACFIDGISPASRREVMSTLLAFKAEVAEIADKAIGNHEHAGGDSRVVFQKVG